MTWCFEPYCYPGRLELKKYIQCALKVICKKKNTIANEKITMIQRTGLNAPEILGGDIYAWWVKSVWVKILQTKGIQYFFHGYKQISFFLYLQMPNGLESRNLCIASACASYNML